MLKLRRADLFVRNGVEGDPWVEPAVGAQNAGSFRGARLRRCVGRRFGPHRPQGPVDRSRGDVHPEGNPHYTLDPGDGADRHEQHRGGARRCAPGTAPCSRHGGRTSWLSWSAVGRWQKMMDPSGAPGSSWTTRLHLLLRPVRARAGRHRRGPPRHSALALPPGDSVRAIKERRVKALISSRMRTGNRGSRGRGHAGPGPSSGLRGGRGEGHRHVPHVHGLQRERPRPRATIVGATTYVNGWPTCSPSCGRPS